MRYFYLFLYSTLSLLPPLSNAYGQQKIVSLLSWNLKDFGKSKNDGQIRQIAQVIRSFDLIAIQEVVAGYGGPQAVARLADELNRTGQKWDYAISEVTSGTSAHKSERYAFIWKVSRISCLSKPWLEKQFGLLIEREPFYGKFTSGKLTFTLVNYHAITKSRQPEREIKYFKFLPDNYPHDNLVFCGDFNIPQSHSVFIPLRKMGYNPALVGQKTSLRQQCINGDCLASEFDNFYFKTSVFKSTGAGVIHFYKEFMDLPLARKLSDHIPIFVNLEMNNNERIR